MGNILDHSLLNGKIITNLSFEILQQMLYTNIALEIISIFITFLHMNLNSLL